MRIVSSPGMNLRASEIGRYDVCIVPLRIMVDGSEHDLRMPVSFGMIDRWMEDASFTPYVVGTTAAEFIEAFRRAAERDTEVLVFTGSRKIIASHRGALSARRTIGTLPGLSQLRVEVLELGSTDGAGTLAITCAGEAIKAGLSLDRVVAATRAFIAASRVVIVPRTTRYLARGGRATFLQTADAESLAMTPLVVFDDGEIRARRMIKRTQMASSIVASLLEQIDADRPLWACVCHGGNEVEAADLAQQIAASFRVEFLTVRPMAPATYLHAGPNALCVFATPVDKLPWHPPPLDPG